MYRRQHRSVAIAEALVTALESDRNLFGARPAPRFGPRMTERIVALGGGHGLYGDAVSRPQDHPHVTAIVTVADDGGSSGRLRAELPIVPRATFADGAGGVGIRQPATADCGRR